MLDFQCTFLQQTMAFGCRSNTVRWCNLTASRTNGRKRSSCSCLAVVTTISSFWPQLLFLMPPLWKPLTLSALLSCLHCHGPLNYLHRHGSPVSRTILESRFCFQSRTPAFLPRLYSTFFGVRTYLQGEGILSPFLPAFMYLTAFPSILCTLSAILITTCT